MTEAACVINQSGIRPSRLCRRHGQSVFQKLKHNLTGRGGLRRHIIQLCEIGVAFVVVNIDFLRCFLENFRRIPQASLVTAVQYEEQLRKPCILCRANQMSIRNQLIFIRIFFQNDRTCFPPFPVRRRVPDRRRWHPHRGWCVLPAQSFPPTEPIP